MSHRSVVLVGGPDSGKTNYVGRLWPALEARRGVLGSVGQPPDIDFVLDVAEHLFEGRFAPRTEHAAERRDFVVTVEPTAGGERTALVVPDVSGELWRRAVLESELAEEWMAELRDAVGAILFVRVGSRLNVRPLDWVGSRRALARLGQADAHDALPTQVMLCELVRFLELTMGARPGGARPRLSVVVSAWDRVDRSDFARGPSDYLRREHPLLAGRLDDLSTFDVQVFGSSVVGGDLGDDPAFLERFVGTPLDGHGWVAAHAADSGEWRRYPDVTLPLAWAVGL